jgi:uncharacterized protein
MIGPGAYDSSRPVLFFSLRASQAGIGWQTTDSVSRETIMKQLILAIALMAATPSFANEQPASEASIRELLVLSDAKNLVDGVYKQMDSMLEQSLAKSLGDKPLNDEQQKLAAEMRAKVVGLMQADMGWDKLEPMYIKLYTDTFSQSDIDGMLKFYKTPAGNALLKKMPLLMQNLMQMMTAQMQGLVPKLRSLVEDYTHRILEAGKPQ